MDASPARAGRYGRAAVRWARLLASRPAAPGIRVFYGHDRIPDPAEPGRGGTAKFQRLVTRHPNRPADFTLLYLGSSWLPRDLRPLLWLARRRNVPLVLNQNGVGYPAWAGREAEEVNRPNRRALLAADHVLYQSEFCKSSAELFLGAPRGAWEVLANAVDVEHFSPAPEPPPDGPILLLAGDQLQPYRLELALRTLALVRRRQPGARLLVSGRHVVPPEQLVADLGLRDAVELVGRYSQADAPSLFRRAHVLLHTTVNDSCPSVVIEAMACGLPVVHPASGGTVELVGDEAGIGVPHAESWERLQPPEPEALADAVDRVLVGLPAYASAARRRAVQRYALGPWLDRHARLFSDLLASPGGDP
jgi:glycosyltransferase involved in cell wall biosynthesis